LNTKTTKDTKARSAIFTELSCRLALFVSFVVFVFPLKAFSDRKRTAR
jgi:hypothetical protein